MKQVTTDDGSLTFFNEQFQEHYHSTSGAAEEAVKKFVEPTDLVERAARQKKIKILDICFGFGYNSAAAIDAIRAVNKECSIEIIGLENDGEVFETIKDLKAPFNSYPYIVRLANNESLDLIEERLVISIVGGDARDSIKKLAKNTKLQETFDAVFLDPFSPQKCPELWTVEFLTSIKQLMKQGAYLTTYSCASQFRKNLQELNFEVKDGPCIGRKSPSTVARRK